MQTLTVIKTIRWIESLLDKQTKDALFSLLGIQSERERGRDINSKILATHELARVSALIEQNPDALQVLKAYQLTALIDRKFISDLILGMIGASAGGDFYTQITPIVLAWRSMTESVGPLETLTTPEELKSKQDQALILSLELRYSGIHNPTLADLSKVSELLQEDYAAVARIYGKVGESRLTVVKIDSGSSIRIDCKGLADIVKHLKDFIIEAWNKLRHKRAEEIVTNNKAMLSSLAVMDRIAIQEKDGSLGPEEAEQLRRRVLDSTLGLFKCGALLTDIPVQETVNNALLLDKFSPKLLTGPKEEPVVKESKERSARKRSRKITEQKPTPPDTTCPPTNLDE